jgi:hypothetical protein
MVRPRSAQNTASCSTTARFFSVMNSQTYLDGDPLPVAAVDVAGIRTLVSVPMLATGIEYRMIVFDDLGVILLDFPRPSPEMLEKMYGTLFDR